MTTTYYLQCIDHGAMHGRYYAGKCPAGAPTWSDCAKGRWQFPSHAEADGARRRLLIRWRYNCVAYPCVVERETSPSIAPFKEST